MHMYLHMYVFFFLTKVSENGVPQNKEVLPIALLWISYE